MIGILSINNLWWNKCSLVNLICFQILILDHIPMISYYGLNLLSAYCRSACVNKYSTRFYQTYENTMNLWYRFSIFWLQILIDLSLCSHMFSVSSPVFQPMGWNPGKNTLSIHQHSGSSTIPLITQHCGTTRVTYIPPTTGSTGVTYILPAIRVTTVYHLPNQHCGATRETYIHLATGSTVVTYIPPAIRVTTVQLLTYDAFSYIIYVFYDILLIFHV